MSPSDDYPSEMFDSRDLNDDAVEQLLEGRPVPGFEAVASFVEDVRSVSAAEVMPSAELTNLFAGGLPMDGRFELNTATVEAFRPAPLPVGRTKRRKRMLEVLIGKVVAFSVVAKAGVAAAAVTAATTTAAATGVLPAAAQDPIADAVQSVVSVDIPGGKDAAAKADFGTAVSDKAKSGAPQEDGRAFGESVAADAKAAHGSVGTEKREAVAPSTTLPAKAAEKRDAVVATTVAPKTTEAPATTLAPKAVEVPVAPQTSGRP